MKQSLFFEKINKINKHLAKLTKRKKMITDEAGNQKGAITTDADDVDNVSRSCLEKYVFH